MKLNPVHLREIRIVRGYTLESLAKLLGVTKQAVSKYENGLASPSPEIIEKMINVLKIPRSYLTKEEIITRSSICPLFFRTKKSTRNYEIDFAAIQVKWAYELVTELYKFLGEKKQIVDIPYFEPGTDIPQKAEILREYWNLGSGPVDNLTGLLEGKGFIILAINSSKIIDAYSQIIDGIPFIILNKLRGSAVRWRFDLAHELGHFILHQYVTDKDLNDPEMFDRIEREADLFAGSFLMPEESFRNSIVSDRLDYFKSLKKEWKVSIAAMIYRCGQLQIFDDKKTARLQKQLSKRKWRSYEPLDNEISYEMPKKVISLIKENINDTNQAFDFLNRVRLAAADIENICCLESGFFSDLGATSPGCLADSAQVDEYVQLSLF
jgi:Zn-dependent peptidase ImmA (M78 family)/DNA-binding XRE family transcriptional regulator